VSSLIESFNESQRPRSRESATDEESTVIANLRDCVRSAERMVSSATSIVVARSSQGSQLQSDYGDGLTEAQRRRIEDWITQPTILEDVETNNVELQTNPSNTGDISGTTSLPDPIPDSSSEGQSDTSNVPAIFQRRTSREWPLASLPPLPPQLPAGLRPSLRKKPSTRKPLRSKINPKAENSQESTSVAKTFESQQNTQGEIYQENDPVSKILDSKKNTETDPIPDSSSEGQSDTRSHRSFVNLRKGDSGRTFQGEVRIPRRRRSLSLAVPQKDAPTTIQSKNNPELENSQEGVSVAKTLASQKNPETDPIADSSSETSEPVAKLPVIKPFRRVLASYIKEAALKRKLESKSNPEAENPQETTSVPKAEAGNSQENSTVSKFWGSKGPSKSEDLWKRGIPFTSEENEVKANNWQKLYARVSPGSLIFPTHDEVIANFERWETLCDQNTPDGRRSWRGLMVADRLGTRIGLPYPSLGKEFRVGDVVLVTSLEGDGVATGFKLRRRIRELARLKADVSWFKDLTKVWADKNSHSFYYTNFCHWRLCIKVHASLQQLIALGVYLSTAISSCITMSLSMAEVSDVTRQPSKCVSL